MDPEIYNRIILDRGDDPFSRQDKKGKTHREPTGIRYFQIDIVRGKTVWVNNKFEDWKLYLRSNHPFVGILHPIDSHPCSRNQRVVRLLGIHSVSLFYAFLSCEILFDVEKDFSDKHLHNLYLQCAAAICINTLILVVHSFCIKGIIRCLQACCRCRSSLWGICLWTLICLAISTGIILLFIYLHLNELVFRFLAVLLVQTVVFELVQLLVLYLQFHRGWLHDKKIVVRMNTFLFSKSEPEAYLMDDAAQSRLSGPYYVSYFEYESFIINHPEYHYKRVELNKRHSSKSELQSVLLHHGNDSLQPQEFPTINKTERAAGISHTATSTGLNDSMVAECLDQIDFDE